MIEGDDGRYYFQAGAICVGGFWRMQDKIGLPLDAIHNEGNVPQCELLSIPRYLITRWLSSRPREARDKSRSLFQKIGSG